MSFAGTPLGQGRRLDHQSFLGKPPSNPSTSSNNSNSNQNQNQRVLPVSYSYGAPPLGSRSPPKTKSSTTELDPEKWSVRDTSVNAATAIYQAMSNQSNPNSNPNSSWASTSRHTTNRTSHPPRSTSVEYESQASTNARRLGAPPSRLGNKSRPLSVSNNNHNNTLNNLHNSSSSKSIVPDSENEQSQSFIREKSPFSFDQLTSLAQSAIQKTSYFVREKEPKQKQKPSVGEESYDYSAEDREYSLYEKNAAEKNAARNTKDTNNANNTNNSTSHRKNRISTDNKAYKPTREELEEESSEDDVGDTRRRRKKKGTGGPAGGPLTTLPKVGPEKRRKKGSRRVNIKGAGVVDGEGEVEGEEEETDQEQEVNVSASQRASVQPPTRRSHSLQPPPPPDTTHSFINHSLNLNAIPEDPDLESHPGEYDDSYSQSYLDDTHSLTTSFIHPNTTGIGAKLGKVVYTLFRLVGLGISSGAHFTGWLLGQIVGLLVIWPIRTASKLPGNPLAYVLVAFLILFGAWMVKVPTGLSLSSSSSSSWNSWNPFSSSSIKYTPPALPVENADELNSRLREIEVALSKLVMENEQTKNRLRITEEEVKAKERELITERQRERSRAQQKAQQKSVEISQEKAELGELGKRLGELEGVVKSDIGGRVERVEKVVGGIRRGNEEEKAREDKEKEAREAREAREVRERREREVQSEKERRVLDQVKKEMESLKSVVGVLQSRPIGSSGPSNDIEARSQLALLEERIGSVEGGVKEALDLGKNALKNLKSSSSNTANTANWWTKLSPTSKSEQDINTLLSSLVSSALSSHSKDTIARADYALHSGGARVIPSLTSDTYTLRPSYPDLKSHLLSLIPFSGSISGGSGVTAVGRPPVWALHPDITNGLCWPFAGKEGQIGIALAAPVVVDSVTVDHVSAETAYEDGVVEVGDADAEEGEEGGEGEEGKGAEDEESRRTRRMKRSKRRSAPREMEVWGLVEGKENIRKVKEWKESLLAYKLKSESSNLDQSSEPTDSSSQLSDLFQPSGLSELSTPYPQTLPNHPQYIRLASFEYDIHSSQHIQTFPVLPYIAELGVDFGVVVAMVRSNWGMEEYTCLYRVRVHGERAVV